MMRRVLTSVVLAAGVLLAGQAAHAQSLEDAMVLTYTTNPTLLAARAELRAVDEQIAQALSGWRPTLSTSADYGYERSETTFTPWSSTNPSSASIRLTQPIYDGGKTSAATSQADNIIFAQRANLTATEQQVLLDTVSAYMDVVLARRVLDLALNNEERLSRQFEATNDRFRVGEVTRTDVAQASASLAGAKSNRISAEGDLTSAQARFEQVIGVAPTDLSTPGALIGLPEDIDQAMETAKNENPSIVAAAYAEAAAADGIDVQYADLLPSVDLSASYTQRYDVSSTLDRQNVGQVLATVTFPLYQAGLEESQVRQSRQTAAQRRMQLDEAERTVQANLIRAWQDLQTARAKIASFTEEVNANQVALDGTEREAQVGERTVLDVLDAEQTLFQSQINLAVAQRDEVVASYTLQDSLGRLTAVDLMLPVTIYDVTTHYDSTRGNWGFGGLFEGPEGE